MPSTAQVSVRISGEVNSWLEQKSGTCASKAAFIRRLVENEMAREREEEELAMFNEAAADLSEEDLLERESLLGGFAGSLRSGGTERE